MKFLRFAALFLCLQLQGLWAFGASPLELTEEQKSRAADFQGSWPGHFALLQPLQGKSLEGWYLSHLRSALRRVLPERGPWSDPGRRDQLDRLFEALSLDPIGRTEAQQILKDHRAMNLGAYLDELDRQVKKEGQARLSAAEVAAIVLFYFRLDERQSLLDGPIRERSSVHLMTKIIGIKHWEGIPVREHGTNQPALPYEGGAANSIRQMWIAFELLGLKKPLIEIFTQLINHNSGNRRFRQIVGLEERVLRLIRQHALEHCPQEAKKFFILFLNNYSSSAARELLDNHSPVNPEIRRELSLAEFLQRFERVTNPTALRRFFETGELPRTDLFRRKLSSRHQMSWGESLKFSTPSFSEFCRKRVSVEALPNVGSVQLWRSIAFFQYEWIKTASDSCTGSIQQASSAQERPSP